MAGIEAATNAATVDVSDEADAEPQERASTSKGGEGNVHWNEEVLARIREYLAANVDAHITRTGVGSQGDAHVWRTGVRSQGDAYAGRTGVRSQREANVGRYAHVKGRYWKRLIIRMCMPVFIYTKL